MKRAPIEANLADLAVSSESGGKRLATKKHFVETHTKADGTKEYMITKSPTKTLTGRIVILVLLAGMVILPLVALIVSIFKAM